MLGEERKAAIYKLVLKREEVADEYLQELSRIDTPDNLVPIIRKLTVDEPQEVLLAFYFIGPGKLIGYSEIARGGFDWVSWDPKMLFSTALLCGATSVAMAHNHPSGSARPSRQDVKGMKKLIPAGSLLGIRIWDHLVVSKGQYVSMSEFGLLPPVAELIKDDEKEREKLLDQAEEAPKGGVAC